jgi:hypothetical protein
MSYSHWIQAYTPVFLYLFLNTYIAYYNSPLQESALIVVHQAYRYQFWKTTGNMSQKLSFEARQRGNISICHQYLYIAAACCNNSQLQGSAIIAVHLSLEVPILVQNNFKEKQHEI